ncbi:MAG: hypothetical protein KDE67_00320, partial [Sphingobium sp.]|nr:hypothetical protein [Sphingobium sp.]
RDGAIEPVAGGLGAAQGRVGRVLQEGELLGGQSGDVADSHVPELVAQLPVALEKCLSYFEACDRSLDGYEGLIAAQDCLPNDERRDAFASDFSILSRIWEALSPDPILTPYEKDYRWLAQVYESLNVDCH